MITTNLRKCDDSEKAYIKTLNAYNDLVSKNLDKLNLNEFTSAATEQDFEYLLRKIDRTELGENAYINALATIKCNLGLLYDDLGQFGEAESSYTEALKIQDELAKINPEA